MHRSGPGLEMKTPGLLVIGLLLAAAFGCGPAGTVVPGHAEDISPVLNGMQAPGFAVTGADGRPWVFDPSQMSKPLVLSFYRGGWCPYCNRQLEGLRHAEKSLNQLGYDVVFLSADRWEILAAGLDDKELGYRLYSDSDLQAARRFGLAFKVDAATVAKYLTKDIDLERASGRKHHWLPVPATFIIDTSGMIRFSYVNPNYKVRLQPELLITAARLALVAGESQ